MLFQHGFWLSTTLLDLGHRVKANREREREREQTSSMTHFLYVFYQRWCVELVDLYETHFWGGSMGTWEVQMSGDVRVAAVCSHPSTRHCCHSKQHPHQLSEPRFHLPWSSAPAEITGPSGQKGAHCSAGNMILHLQHRIRLFQV